MGTLETVRHFFMTDFSICIKTDTKEINMSLRDDDYLGPEAFEFYGNNGEWIID